MERDGIKDSGSDTKKRERWEIKQRKKDEKGVERVGEKGGEGRESYLPINKAIRAKLS